MILNFKPLAIDLSERYDNLIPVVDHPEVASLHMNIFRFHRLRALAMQVEAPAVDFLALSHPRLVIPTAEESKDEPLLHSDYLCRSLRPTRFKTVNLQRLYKEESMKRPEIHLAVIKREMAQ